MDNLPENVVQIEMLQRVYNRGRRCDCYKPKYLLDVPNHEVTCKVCGLPVEPFEALKNIASDIDRWNSEVQGLFKQRQELLDWQPHLVALREVEKTYRGGKYIPSCPHCKRGLLAEDLVISFIGKEQELNRRKFEKESEAKP
jgi:hypothetical protein